MPFGRLPLMAPDLFGPAAFAAEAANRQAMTAMATRFIDLSLSDARKAPGGAGPRRAFTRPVRISARETTVLAYGRCRISAGFMPGWLPANEPAGA